MKPIPAHVDGLTRLREIVHDLRSPGGCPWDREQTHQSLLTNLLEEAYESVEAIQSGDAALMCEELGDLLLQVVLHGEIAGETGAFDLDRIAHGIAEKLIRRHPHVYGDSTAGDTEAVLKQWDEIKRSEKGDSARPWLHGITRALPALSRSVKIQKQAAQAGFDWPDAAGVIDKIREETVEVSEALNSCDPGRIAEETGDLLFSVANLARKLNLDPEVLLTGTNEKFIRRFTAMEQVLAARGRPVGTASLDEMESEWQAAKPGQGERK